MVVHRDVYGKWSSRTQTHFTKRLVSPLSRHSYVNIEHNCSGPVSERDAKMECTVYSLVQDIPEFLLNSR